MYQLQLIIHDVQPDIVHTFSTKPGIYGRIAASRNGVPAIVGTINGVGRLYSNGAGRSVTRAIYERLQRRASGGSNAVVFQNTWDRDEFVRRGLVHYAKSRVIPGSGVDTCRYRPASGAEKGALRERYCIPVDQPVFIMVTRVIREKGVLEYAEAASQIHDATFLLVGDVDHEGSGYSAGELEKIRRNIHWLGRRDDVPELLRASDVLVLPTRYREGIPRSVMEAMATGLPVVTTHEGSGGLDVGHTMASYDDQAVATGMNTIINMDRDKRWRIGHRNRCIAETTLNINRIAEQYADLYRSLPARSHTAAVSVPS